MSGFIVLLGFERLTRLPAQPLRSWRWVSKVDWGMKMKDPSWLRNPLVQFLTMIPLSFSLSQSTNRNVGETDSDGHASGAEVDEEPIEEDLELKLHIMGSKQLYTETYPQFPKLLPHRFQCGTLSDDLAHWCPKDSGIHMVKWALTASHTIPPPWEFEAPSCTVSRQSVVPGPSGVCMLGI